VVSLSFTLKDPETYNKTERRYAGIVAKESFNEPDPRKIEQMGRDLPKEELLKSTVFLEKWSDVIDLISKFQEIGVTQVVLPSGADRKMIRTFGQKVLPQFKTKSRR